MDVAWTPRMRATVVGDSPCSTSSTARRRRRSSSAEVPLGLMPHYTHVQCLGMAFVTLDSVGGCTGATHSQRAIMDHPRARGAARGARATHRATGLGDKM